MSIAQKEISETIHWLELMQERRYISKQEFESINADAVEIIKMVTSSLKTVKSSLTINH